LNWLPCNKVIPSVPAFGTNGCSDWEQDKQHALDDEGNDYPHYTC
jgi:hypothetical protein